MSSEIPKTYISKEKAEKECGHIKDILKRRRITEPLKPSSQDYEEAHQKLEGNKGKESMDHAIKAEKIQDLFDVVLFDWDGVLYDSMETLAEGVVRVCRDFGVEIDKKKFLESYDQPYQEWFEKLGIPAKNKNVDNYLRCLYNDEIKPMLRSKRPDRLFSDVVDVFKKLKEKGIVLGIVSAERKEYIQKVLVENEIFDLVDYIFGDAHNKTDVIKKLWREKSFSPDRVLMVGDLPSDLRDARKAGIKVAGIARQKEDFDRLGSYDPDYLMGDLENSLFELYPYVDKKNE